MLLSACANDEYFLSEVPNYDDLVGKKFTEVIHPVAQLGFKKLNETNESEELEDKRPDGCSTVFEVRKADGVITHWRVTPSPSACKVRRKPFNV
jgi:hypothetical protein